MLRYGPSDRFSTNFENTVAGLIAKAYDVNSASLTVNIPAEARSQLMLSDDFARIIYFMVQNKAPFSSVILAPPIEHTMKEVGEKIAARVKKTINFDSTKSDNHFGNYSISAIFCDYMPGFTWTGLHDGLRLTMDWYEENMVK